MTALRARLLTGLVIAAALQFVAVFVAFRLANPVIPVLSWDSLYELRDWLDGDTWFGRLHHNASPSPVQAALTALDVWVVPYPLATEVFTVLSTFLAAAAILWACSTAFGRDVGLALTAVFLLWNGCILNKDTLFYYTWRQSELGLHMLSLGGLLIAMRTLDTRGRGVNVAVFLILIALSLTHKAFVYPFAFLIMAAVSRRLGWTVWLALAAVYAVTLADLAYTMRLHALTAPNAGNQLPFDVEPLSGPARIVEMARAYIALVTAPLSRTVLGMSMTPTLRAVRLVIFAAIWLGAALLLWRLRGSRDLRLWLALCLVGMGLTLMLLATVQRIDVYGVALHTHSRYWFDVFLVVFGLLMFAATWANRWAAWTVTGLVLAYLAVLQPLVWTRIEGYSRYHQQRNTLIYMPVFGWPRPEVTENEVTARATVDALLRQREAGIYRSWLMALRDGLRPPADTTAPCALAVPPETWVGRSGQTLTGYDLAFDTGPAPDGIVLWQGDRVMSLAVNGVRGWRHRMWLAVPGEARDLRVSLHDRSSGPTATRACRLPDPGPPP